MNIIFVGIQGSGKGTQASVIAKELGLAHISTGDLFRGAKGELGQKLKEIMDAGQLVPNELTLQILKERMIQDDCENGIILDGFPRNLEQAQDLEKEIKIDKVIEIKISDDESMKRLSGRISCENCKANYNILTTPKPAQEGICDKCGGKLIQRADDTPIAIQKRIDAYHEQTEPILEFYKEKLIEINGEQKIENVKKDILETLN